MSPIPKAITPPVLDDFPNWNRDELARYLEFLLHNYRVMDAFWFLNIEKDHGLTEACRINEMVWGKVGTLAARDLKKRYGITAGGIAGFVQVLRLFPWTTLVGYQIEEHPDHVLVSVPHCPPQAARLARNLGEYPCQAMHRAEFQGLAAEIDPDLRVDCLFAPPDPHPENLFCQWRFDCQPTGLASSPE